MKFIILPLFLIAVTNTTTFGQTKEDLINILTTIEDTQTTTKQENTTSDKKNLIQNISKIENLLTKNKKDTKKTKEKWFEGEISVLLTPLKRPDFELKRKIGKRTLTLNRFVFKNKGFTLTETEDENYYIEDFSSYGVWGIEYGYASATEYSNLSETISVYGWRVFLGKDESTETGGELMWGLSDFNMDKVVAANVNTGDISLSYFKKYGIIEPLLLWEVTPKYSPKPFVKEQGGTIKYRFNSTNVSAETEIGVKRTSKRVLDPSLPAEITVARALYQSLSYKNFNFSGTYLGKYYQDMIATLSISPSFVLLQNYKVLGMINSISIGTNFLWQDTEQDGWEKSRDGIIVTILGNNPKLSYSLGYRYDRVGITQKQSTGFLSGNISYRANRDFFLSYGRSQSLLGLQKTENNFLNASYKNISTSISYSTSSYEKNKSENIGIRLGYNSPNIGASIHTSKSKSLSTILGQTYKRTDTRKGWQLSLPKKNLTIYADYSMSSERYAISKYFMLKEYGRFLSLNLEISKYEEATLDSPARYWLMSMSYGF